MRISAVSWKEKELSTAKFKVDWDNREVIISSDNIEVTLSFIEWAMLIEQAMHARQSQNGKEIG